MKHCRMRNLRVLAALLICGLTLCPLSACRSGFHQGGVSSASSTDTTTPLTPEQEMSGYWFSPTELRIYHFTEDGGFTLFILDSPTVVREERTGSFTLEDGRLTLTVDGRTSVGRLTTDRGNALILTLDGVEHILTPTSRPEI